MKKINLRKYLIKKLSFEYGFMRRDIKLFYIITLKEIVKLLLDGKEIDFMDLFSLKIIETKAKKINSIFTDGEKILPPNKKLSINVYPKFKKIIKGELEYEEKD